MSKFKIPPISTLAGTGLINYFKVISGGKIQKEYYLKVILTFLIILIGIPFRLWEKIYFHFPLKRFKYSESPVFILGHWRSGTTFLHNMLCKDPKAAYLTTYNSVFPNNLGSKFLFKTFQRISMPDKRPADNVELRINNPQEDEFALANLIDNTYYNFFFFPENYQDYFKRSIEFKVSEKEIIKWNDAYKEVIEKAILNTSGSRAFIKNPVNTGRIEQLLKIYPDARFIYIHRNPVIVFLSTRRFFTELFPTLWFHEFDEESIENMILDVYKRLLKKYETEKSLIPPGNLYEISFDEFEKDPLKRVEEMYSQFFQNDFKDALPHFEEYLESQKSYKKTKNVIKKSTLNKILKEWNEQIEKYGYSVPDNIEVIED